MHSERNPVQTLKNYTLYRGYHFFLNILIIQDEQRCRPAEPAAVMKYYSISHIAQRFGPRESLAGTLGPNPGPGCRETRGRVSLLAWYPFVHSKLYIKLAGRGKPDSRLHIETNFPTNNSQVATWELSQLRMFIPEEEGTLQAMT
jgi:hypothetical protein